MSTDLWNLWMLRTSSYTIYVDLPDAKPDILIVQGYTGAYDRVSPEVAGYLQSLEVGPAPKPLYGEWQSDLVLEPNGKPSDETLKVLERRGYLTRKTPEEESKLFAHVAQTLHQRNLAARPSYLFMPSYNCNLRCPYCFQDEMRTNSKLRHLLRVISTEMIDRIFLGMADIEGRLPPLEDGVERQRRIGFFGGEPLMEKTLPAVEYIYEKARSETAARFWAVSNATELEHYRHLLGPDKIAEIQITLDGTPEEHDKRRIYADGSGSFDKIADNIKLALDLGVQVSVRVNIDRNNIEDLPPLADEMYRQGWAQYKNFSTYTAAVWAANEQTDRKTTFNSLQLDREIVRLRGEHDSMKIVGSPDDRLKSQVRQIFDQHHDPMPSFRSSFCGAHTNMYIFDAFGDIYACWEHTGDPKVRIGNVEADGTVDLKTDFNHMWRSRTVVSNPVCGRCRYALYCGGGCAIRAWKDRDEFFSNYCDQFQKRFRVTVGDAFLDHTEGRETMQQNRVCDL